MISHSKRFIFIHIPKTAGSSISDALAHHSRAIERVLYLRAVRKPVNALATTFGLRNSGDSWITGVHQHAKALDYLNFLGPQRFEEYYKFACVRNPINWLVSEYLYIQRSRYHPRYETANLLNCNDFIQSRIAEGLPTQTSYLIVKEHISVNKILTVENLEADINCLFRRLSLPKRDIPRLNFSNFEKKQEMLDSISQMTLSQVYEAYSEDFSNFGYAKEPPCLLK